MTVSSGGRGRIGEIRMKYFNLYIEYIYYIYKLTETELTEGCDGRGDDSCQLSSLSSIVKNSLGILLTYSYL